MAAMRLPLLFTQDSELPAADNYRFSKFSEVLVTRRAAAPDVRTVASMAGVKLRLSFAFCRVVAYDM